MGSRYAALFIVWVAALLGGCGEASVIDSTAASPRQVKWADKTEQRPDLDQIGIVKVPPAGYYQHLFISIFANIERKAYHRSDAISENIFWLRYEGVALRQGFARGESYLICDEQAIIPSSELSDKEQDAVTQAVQSKFDELGIKVEITTQKPNHLDFTTVIIGGTARDLGCADDSILGLAPFDTDNANKSDTVFVFDQSILKSQGAGTEEVIHQVTSQIGRAIGIQDISTYTALQLTEPATRSANQIENLAFTTSENTLDANPFSKLPSHLLSLPGLAEIATITQLLPELDPNSIAVIDDVLPSVRQLMPTGHESNPLIGLDKALTIVTRLGSQLRQTPKFRQSYATVQFIDQKHHSDTTTRAEPVLASSNQSSGDNLKQGLGVAKEILEIFSKLINRQQNPAPLPPDTPESKPPEPVDRLESLPNLPDLLGLDGGSNARPAAIINNFAGSAQAVASCVNSGEYDAMISLIKVAYAQAWSQSGSKP